MMETPTRGEALLDLLFSNVEELIREVKIGVGCSLGCSDHTLVELPILRGTGQVKSRDRTLNLRKANFQLFRVPVPGIPWEIACRGKGVKESCEIFKDIFLRVIELSILMCMKLGRKGRRTAWLSQDLLAKLKHKTEMCRWWRQRYTYGPEVQGGDQENQGTVGAGFG